MGDGTTINKTTVLNRFGVFVVLFVRRPAAGPTFGGSEDRRLRKEEGEPRGGNNHWFFPLVLSGQMSAAGRAHGPRFPSVFFGMSVFKDY